MAASYLVVLFCATAGQNGEQLGVDEDQIILFVYLLYDVANNKVVAVQHHYVRPHTDDLSETILKEECKAETGVSEEAVKNGLPLEQVLDEFDRFISSKEVHPDHGGKSFCFCTDGQLHMRMCLHPEAFTKNMTLPHYYYRFYDVRKEFRKFYKTSNINCIKDMLDYLGQEGDQSVEYGVKHCQEMATVIARLLNDGHQFAEPETVKDRLEPGICTKTDYVDDETVIRARGLPWQSSDQDIAKFFSGLNVEKGGVALCLSQHGRRNGEALVRFESKEHRDLALRKHKHHLGQRYIEVYKATGKDFVNVAGGNNTEAQAFLSRHSGNCGQVIVRMRGLPYTTTAEQVLEFFRSGDNACEVLDGEDGILFVHQADGRATGDAFVLFASEEEAAKALSKHRESIGARYIELFKSTTAEVQQVLNRTMDPRSTTTEPEAALPPLIPQIPATAGALFMPQQTITCGSTKDCIRLRGLPFESSVTDLLSFLGEHSRNIVFQGVHMVYNSQGTPAGEAFIQMDSEQSAEIAALSRHKKFILIANKKRYIEVIQCSGEDMNVVLTNGVAAMPTPAVLPPQVQMMPRPMLSAGAGGSVLPPGYTSAMYPQYPQFAAPQQTSAAATAAAMMSSLQPSVSPATFPHPALSHLPTRPSPYYQPLLYWYPSPPVSPQSTYYINACPSTVVVKGLSFNTQPQDILAFFEGLYEMTPDVQIQRGPDGRPNGEAYITFGSRSEAERAITERNRKIIGNRYVELHMA